MSDGAHETDGLDDLAAEIDRLLRDAELDLRGPADGSARVARIESAPGRDAGAREAARSPVAPGRGDGPTPEDDGGERAVGEDEPERAIERAIEALVSARGEGSGVGEPQGHGEPEELEEHAEAVDAEVAGAVEKAGEPGDGEGSGEADYNEPTDEQAEAILADLEKESGVGAAAAGASGDEGSASIEDVSASIARLFADQQAARVVPARAREVVPPAPPVELGFEASEPVEEVGETEGPEAGGAQAGTEALDAEALDRSLAALTSELLDAGASGSDESALEAVAPESAAVTADTAAAEDLAAAVSAEVVAAGVVTASEVAPGTPTERAVEEVVATAPKSEGSSRAAARVHGRGRRAREVAEALARRAEPAVRAGALAVSRPLLKKPKAVRDAVGWLALGTGFFAACVWFFVLVRQPSVPEVAEVPVGIEGAEE